MDTNTPPAGWNSNQFDDSLWSPAVSGNAGGATGISAGSWASGSGVNGLPNYAFCRRKLIPVLTCASNPSVCGTHGTCDVSNGNCQCDAHWMNDILGNQCAVEIPHCPFDISCGIGICAEDGFCRCPLSPNTPTLSCQSVIPPAWVKTFQYLYMVAKDDIQNFLSNHNSQQYVDQSTLDSLQSNEQTASFKFPLPQVALSTLSSLQNFVQSFEIPGLPPNSGNLLVDFPTSQAGLAVSSTAVVFTILVGLSTGVGALPIGTGIVAGVILDSITSHGKTNGVVGGGVQTEGTQNSQQGTQRRLLVESPLNSTGNSSLFITHFADLKFSSNDSIRNFSVAVVSEGYLNGSVPVDPSTNNMSLSLSSDGLHSYLLGFYANGELQYSMRMKRYFYFNASNSILSQKEIMALINETLPSFSFTVGGTQNITVLPNGSSSFISAQQAWCNGLFNLASIALAIALSLSIAA